MTRALMQLTCQYIALDIHVCLINIINNPRTKEILQLKEKPDTKYIIIGGIHRYRIC